MVSDVDPALRDRCRRHVLQRYAWEVLIPQVEELMQSMVRDARYGMTTGVEGTAVAHG